MKKIVALLLTLLLCGSLFACVAVQNAQDAFFQSEAGSMIGKTYEEVEAAFGPLSVVYLEKDRPAAYIFNNSTVSFHFHAPLVQKRWAALLTDKVGFIPSSIALRDIQPTDKCIGVSGRIRDFGIADSDVNELSASLQTLRPEPEETKTNTIYTLTTPDQNYEVRVFCAKGETAVTPNHQIQVMLTKLTPAADPSVTEFTFGGVTIPVGETKVEVRGTSKVHKTFTTQEFTDLVTYCPNLQSLVLDYGELSGVEQVGLLTDLTYLEIMTCGLNDISFVEDLTKLTHLSICHNNVSDITPIEDLPLTYLNLADNPIGNGDLRSVGYINTMETLYIYSLNISDLSAISPLKRLTILNVNNDSRLNADDLSVVNCFPKLRKLQINGTGVTDLDFLFDDCPGLKELDARKLNKLDDRNETLLALAQHPNLTKLSLSKDIQESLDEDALALYSMSATDWFASQDVKVSFQ